MATRYGIILYLILFVSPPSTMNMNLNPTSNQNMQSNKLFHLFDMELMKKLDRRSNGNILVSPLSLKQVLAMVLEGAEGESAHELTVAINSLSEKEQIKYLFYDILRQLNKKRSGVQFENANRIFVSENVKPEETYKKILQEYYQSDINSVKFSKPIETSHTINSWVYNVTRGLIPSLISPNSITSQTSIILANALYFKGLWKKSFNLDSTSRTCFSQFKKSCYHTYMMDATDYFNYAEWKVNDLEVKALELPYKDNEFSMLILLPRKDLFSRMMHNLPIIYPEIIKKLTTTEVRALIPRFSIDFSDDIARILEEMDIRDIFSPERAELTRMIKDKTNHYVSNVFHKAKIEVNEEGTEAAASTGFVVIPLMGTTQPMFRADHPFIFFVRHVPTGAILFAGRVTEPQYAPPEDKSEEYPANTYSEVKPHVQSSKIPQQDDIDLPVEMNNKKVYSLPNAVNAPQNTPYATNPRNQGTESENTSIVFQNNVPPELTRRAQPQSSVRQSQSDPSVRPYVQPVYTQPTEQRHRQTQEQQYRQTQEQQYRQAQEQQYRQAQEQQYRQAQEQQYRPTPEQQYRPTQEPHFQPILDQQYRQIREERIRQR